MHSAASFVRSIGPVGGRRSYCCCMGLRCVQAIFISTMQRFTSEESVFPRWLRDINTSYDRNMQSADVATGYPPNGRPAGRWHQ